MKRCKMIVTPTVIARIINLLRDVRGGCLSDPINRRFVLALTLLVLVLVMLCGACRKQPPAAEIRGPMIGMRTATGFDDKGQLQNPSFAFAPTAPQLVVIVEVGKLDSDGQAFGAHFIQLETVAAAAPESVVNITWYRVSDESEEKLFEHQVKVQSYDRAYSIGRSKGIIKAGTYKVRATLAGQTQETELQIQPAKTESASIASSQVLVNQAPTVGDGDDEGPGEPPVAGGSGIVPGSSGASAESGDSNASTSSLARKPCDIAVNSIENTRADQVRLSLNLRCPKNASSGERSVYVSIETEANTEIGILESVPGIVLVKPFGVNPCLLREGKDLPGTRLVLFYTDFVDDWITQYISLGPDQDAPKVSVNSSPRKGTKVKAGDVIKIDTTASERRTGGTWQTGVQRLQLVRSGPGGKIEELIQEVTDPSRLPKQCAQKSWSKVLAASYKVPNNPPPVIKLCAIGEDYAGNEGFKCGEFPTGDVWEGTLQNDVTVAVLGQRCTGSWQGKIKIVVGEDGTASGEITVVDASPNSCGGSTYATLGSKLPIKGIVNDAGFTFALSQFMGGQVEGSAFIQKSGRNQASGTATPSYSPSVGITNSFVMQFQLKCKTCGS